MLQKLPDMGAGVRKQDLVNKIYGRGCAFYVEQNGSNISPEQGRGQDFFTSDFAGMYEGPKHTG